MSQEKLLKANEVAEILRVSKTQVFRMMHAGELPHLRFGPQTYRVKESDLRAYIARMQDGGS